MNKINMSQSCLCKISYKKSYQIFTATSRYGRHSAIVQHNNNFATVHRRDLMPSNASLLVSYPAHVRLPGRNSRLGDTVAKVYASLRIRLSLFVLTKWEVVQLVPTKAFLQPAKAAAMCTAPHTETRPPPPIPPGLLVQNLSSKRIAPTDNMRPKSDNTKWRHRWLKG